ncbi:nitroreductase family protein [Krasilnikovia cinnamomea]|uniref:Nitroreductase family protein n=1 Tax=Krasilnikovia cinnamomea TaxID=349313 RepID=A0A4Q7ZTM0_9ACTN|nr:nitroreductase family protein [Krasilnikovia cinnamomea]RZU54598.1 nitroreductase family protein [Krasilnikovia cinnamomea]
MTARYTEADLRRAAAAGIRAPSLHNSQPWLFRLHDGGIEVLSDTARQLAVADRAGWALRIACGAATFNARLALAVAGTPAEVTLRPADAAPEVMARLTPAEQRPATYREQDLCAAIPHRFSNRRPFWPNPVPSEVRALLIEAARAEAGWLDLLVGMTALSGFAEIAQSADRVLRRNPRYQAELVSWAHSDAALDGVPVTAGAPSPEPQDLLPTRPFAEHRRAPGRDFEPEPLVAILGTAGDRAVDQLQAGQALQRVLLTATDAGLASSMISQPIEVPAAREQLRRSLGRFGTPQMALRIGYGQPGQPTPRRDVAEVLVD